MTANVKGSRRGYSSWEPVADWYDGWMGKEGSEHHRRLAIPTVMELLEVQAGERVLDVGAGQGVLAPWIARARGVYTGVDASERMVHMARKQHGGDGKFVVGDARRLQSVPGLQEGRFDAAVFLLSIQDMDPLELVMESVTWAVRVGGRVVVLMTHPCFRVPRQSGWGWQEERQMQYRRVDRYLTPLTVPMKSHPGRKGGATISFHRPLQDYMNVMAEYELLVERMKEITTYKALSGATRGGPRGRAEERANQEIPLFLGLRARKRG